MKLPRYKCVSLLDILFLFFSTSVMSSKLQLVFISQSFVEFLECRVPAGFACIQSF